MPGADRIRKEGNVASVIVKLTVKTICVVRAALSNKLKFTPVNRGEFIVHLLITTYVSY